MLSFAVASPSCLDDPIQRTEGSEDDREIDVDACLYDLCADKADGSVIHQALSNLFENELAVGGTQS